MNALRTLPSRMMNAIRCARGNDGFSLIEMLVATAVSSIILIMIYSAHRSIMSATNDLTRIAAFYERVNLAISMIDRDISCAYVNRANKDICFISENNMSAPFHGKLNFVTVDFRAFSMSADPTKEARRGDVHEVGYFVKAARDRADYFLLMKREEPSYDNEPDEGGRESILLEDIVDVKFEFKLRNSWADSWDSRRYNKYPDAVKTTIKMKNYRGDEESFVFVSFVNLTK